MLKEFFQHTFKLKELVNRTNIVTIKVCFGSNKTNYCLRQVFFHQSFKHEIKYQNSLE